MIRLTQMLRLILVFAMLLSAFGCAHLLNTERETPQQQSGAQTEDIYSREIERLNQIVKKNPNSSPAKRAHLRLAELYLSHNNYRRNYHKAHKHMQAYIRLEKNITSEETHNWIAALREIFLLSQELESRDQQIAKLQAKLEKAQRQGGAVQHSNRVLKQKEVELMERNASLEATNQKLLQTIEMLKRLDQRLEEKRRILNN